MVNVVSPLLSTVISIGFNSHLQSAISFWYTQARFWREFENTCSCHLEVKMQQRDYKTLFMLGNKNRVERTMLKIRIDICTNIENFQVISVNYGSVDPGELHVLILKLKLARQIGLTQLGFHHTKNCFAVWKSISKLFQWNPKLD